jgi:predicted GIY-YIG superfamily endonuclease
MGTTPDYRRLASETLGIRGASEALARRLVSQALVVEDRREAWRRTGVRICRAAPGVPGVYVLRGPDGEPLYVGKAVNLKRRLSAHFAERRWKATKPALAQATDAEWETVGSELEALLREADLIQRLQPMGNVQIGCPDFSGREIPSALLCDVLVLLPSVEADCVELVGARLSGDWIIQRTRRNGADLAIHSARLRKFFSLRGGREAGGGSATLLGPIVFSWLARRGATATRFDPHDVRSARDLRTRLATLFADERLFAERLVIYS